MREVSSSEVRAVRLCDLFGPRAHTCLRGSILLLTLEEAKRQALRLAGVHFGR